jgi:uncharacterized membrane protein
MTLYDVLVVVHVVSIIAFVGAHAVSATAMFQVRSEPDPGRLAAILGRSTRSLSIALLAVIVSLIAGIVLGVMGSHFGRFWIWASLILLVGVGAAMTPMAAIPMGNVRRALGIQVGKLKEGEAPAAPQGDAAVAAARAALRPEIVAILGVGAVVVITWLMFSKPF